jgi:uroporphyrinogen decarboxylase
MKNDLLLRAAKGEETERVPVWVMRQAGRILPGYRKIREKVKDFKEFVKTPALACEATLEPVNVLGVDAAIIFSDILVVPEAMGLDYEMLESKGPMFEKTIQSQKDIDGLRIGSVENWSYVTDAIKLAKSELNGRVPLIGFAGSPWTIFAYMTEGKGSKTFSVAKRMLYSEPKMAHALLEKITQTTIKYLKDQVNAGAQIIQIFDSWGGILSPESYEEFSLPYIAKICDELNKLVPVIAFPKGAFFSAKKIAKLNCSVVSLDWTVDPVDARNLLPGKCLQGNLDPCVLYADPSVVKSKTHKMLEQFGTKGYIANLGHGVYPDIPMGNVKHFIDSVKQYSGK